MNRKRLTISAMITLLLPAAITAPARANSWDDNMRRWYTAPLQVQITDDSARVSMPTQPPAQASYIINVGPFQQAPALPPVMITPSRNAPNIVNLTSSQPAGFQSNIPVSGPAAANLPSARSTNLLAGKIQPSRQFSSAAAAPPRSLIKAPAATVDSAPSLQILTYGTSNYNGGTRMVTSSSVTGKVK